MTVHAVMIVRDESMLIGVNLAYHRWIGIDRFWIIDNGSTDHTPELLEEQAGRYGDVVWRRESGEFAQARITTTLARQAHSDGAEWIIAIDADEFWSFGLEGPRGVLERCSTEGGALQCSVVNFVQRRSVRIETHRSLLSMTHRAVAMGSADEAEGLVRQRRIGFVEMHYPPKHIFRASADLMIGPGNHSGRNVAGSVVASEATVLHAPLRSRMSLDVRAKHGREFEQSMAGTRFAWHTRRWGTLSHDQLDDEWSANSHRFGRLDVDGRRHRLVRDTRLRDAVRPFIGNRRFSPADDASAGSSSVER